LPKRCCHFGWGGAGPGGVAPLGAWRFVTAKGMSEGIAMVSRCARRACTRGGSITLPQLLRSFDWAPFDFAQDRPSHQGTRTESTQASEYLSRDDLPAWAKRCHAERWVSVFPSTSAVHRSRQGCRIEGRTSRLCREFRALLDDLWLEGALFAYIDMTHFHLVTAYNFFSSPFNGLA
jgi:hypothetical protein